MTNQVTMENEDFHPPLQAKVGGLFKVEKFSGEEDEDVEEFLDAVMLSFMPQEVHYRTVAQQERARMLFLASMLDGKAKRWWKSVEKNKRDTWDKTTNLFKTRFAARIGVLGREVGEWTRANAEFSLPSDTLPFAEPDWSNPGSIYTWFQRFTLQRGRNPLVGTFGRDFKFLGRENTIEALWDGNGLRPGIAKRFEKHNEHDKNIHPIPILAGGPGTGKSRFLDEIEGLIFRCASNSPDINIQKGFENMAVINVNYGNGSAASDMDIQIGAQASLSLRLLFEYFRPEDPPKAPLNYGGFVNLHAKNPRRLTLYTALSVIAKDFTTHKQKSSDSTLVIVVGIDEINRLHDWDNEVLRHLIHSIGAVMCSPPTNIYFIPILAGTIEGPLERYISGSMHKALPLPLPLLSVDDAIKISNLDEVDGFEEYVAHNPSFRMSVSDLGGHARTLEYFYERFTQLVKEDKCSFGDINIVKIISKVRDTISDDYQLKRFPGQLEGVAIKVLLNQEVRESDLVAGSGESYRDFSDRGILSLVPSTRHGFWKIRIPYLWMCTFIEFSDSPLRKYWEEMLKYDEPMYWQNFEMFNLKFLVMRLTLLRMTGLAKVDLKEFLQGATFSKEFPEVDIILPTEARLGQMRHRYPETGTIRQSGDNAREFHTTSGVSITKIDRLPNEDIPKHCGRVILNAPGACWDFFMFLEIQFRGEAQGKIGTLCLTGQVKKASVESSNPLVANDHLLSTDHAKAAKAVSNVPVDEWVYLFLADAETRNLDIKTKDNCAFVGDGEFADFYGYSYSSRAQFASANEIIYINHAYLKSLQILGFSEEEAKEVLTKRKRRYFDSLDDLRERLGLGDKRLKSMENTISFARLA